MSSTIKEPSYFSDFTTFFEKGIEILMVNKRPHRVYRSASKNQMWLLPITSAFDEAAKDKHNNYNKIQFR